MTGLFVLGFLILNISNGAMVFKEVQLYDNYEDCRKAVDYLHDEGSFPRVDGDYYEEVVCLKMPGSKS